ncbi:MAG TPA: phage holin family protein [Pyrinomonadaceae bacterium]|jgi:uncharacterized membrane protein YqjE|nr:phage holin family protein [Pyrinomonadaceae bacterium]
MAELEKRAGTAPATQMQADVENLPALLGRLGDNVMKFVDSKLSLVKVELKEDAAVYARGGAMIAVGAVIAAIGFALVNVAVACFVSLLFASDEAGAVTQRYTPKSYGLGFLITGVVYLVIGGVIAYLAKNRLAAYNPAPTASLEEIRKDKQWLKNEM